MENSNAISSLDSRVRGSDLLDPADGNGPSFRRNNRTGCQRRAAILASFLAIAGTRQKSGKSAFRAAIGRHGRPGREQNSRNVSAEPEVLISRRSVETV